MSLAEAGGVPGHGIAGRGIVGIGAWSVLVVRHRSSRRDVCASRIVALARSFPGT
jgi:hypothetical protein